MTQSLTPDLRQRQLRDEDMKCGNQPANIRMINRRFYDHASTGDLENSAVQTSFENKNCEGRQMTNFLLTSSNHIRVYIYALFRRSMFHSIDHKKVVNYK